MSSTTDAGRRLAALPLLFLLAGAAMTHPFAAPAPDPSRPATLKPSELRARMKKIEKRLFKAEDALSGKSPRRVSVLLRLADEEIVRFRDGSGLDPLVEAFAAARDAVRQEAFGSVSRSLRAIREIMPALSDFSMVRDAEVAYRAALQGADDGDAAVCIESFAALESAVLVPVLVARLGEMRDAIARGRDAMVRNDMEAGRDATAGALAALDGLHFAASLSRALFAMQLASEFLEDGYPPAARLQLRQGVRELRLAAGLAAGPTRAELESVLTLATALEERIARPEPGDARQLEEAIRLMQRVRDAEIEASGGGPAAGSVSIRRERGRLGRLPILWHNSASPC